jgi:uncharacterized protein
MEKKLKKLQQILKRMNGILVAYSGGVDSTLLLKIAKDVLGDQVLAVTAISPTFTKRENQAARNIAKMIKVKHKRVKTHELDCQDFTRNPPNRCYFCKRELFSLLKSIAKQEGCSWIKGTKRTGDSKPFKRSRFQQKRD